MADTQEHMDPREKANFDIEQIINLNILPKSPNAIFNYWSKALNGDSGIVLQQMSQILEAVKKMDASKKEAINQFTKAMADFIQKKFTADLLKNNQVNIMAILNNLAPLVPNMNIIDAMRGQFSELGPGFFQSIADAAVDMADRHIPGAKGVINGLRSLASGSAGSMREQIKSGVVATVKKFAKIENLGDLVKQLTEDPLVSKVLKFAEIPGSTNTLNLMYKAAETVASASPVGKALSQVGKKIAEVAMSATEVRYTLMEEAFTNPSTAVSGVVPTVNEALKSALIAAAKSGEQPLQLAGGDAKQVLEICQAAIATGIQVEVNTVVPAVKAALESASQKDPNFKDFIIEPDKVAPTDQRRTEPPRAS